MSKRCTKCDESLPLSSFHRDSRSKDGRRASCAPCVAKSSRARSEAEPVWDPSVTHKTCTKCNLILHIDDFGVARRMMDGRNSRCRVCCSEATAEWQRSDVGRVKHAEAVRRYRERKKWGDSGGSP